MKPQLFLVAFLRAALLARGDASCRSAMARPGDTCDSFAAKYGITVSQLLALNPQIGGMSGCPSRLYAWNLYCVSSPTQQQPTTHAQAPEQVATTFVTTTIAPPSSPSLAAPPRTVYITTTTTATVTSPPLTITTTVCTPPPPRNTICPVDDCYRAFEQVHGKAESSQSSWCTSLLHAKPPVTAQVFDADQFPGIPNLAAMQCGKLKLAADVVMSSYCSCYTSGQMNNQGRWTSGIP